MDSVDMYGYLNDLWEFNPVTKMWTWMGGSNVVNQMGIYGTKGVPAATNIPGAREDGISWTDSNGNLWLFGGYDEGSIAMGRFNDLWIFNTITKIWTWMSGSNTANQMGVYGTEGVPAATSIPGARISSISLDHSRRYSHGPIVWGHRVISRYVRPSKADLHVSSSATGT
jgi:hypothetical protein